MKGRQKLYHIAICDDDERELENFRNLLKAYRIQRPEADFSVKSFVNPDDLLKKVEERAYDPNLLFLDICMPGMKGIQVAEELLRLNSLCRIIFITNSKEYAVDAFRVGAIHYLIKPVSEKELFAALEQFFLGLEKEKERYLILKTKGAARRIALTQIVCCEAQGNYQCLYLKDKSQLTLRMTLSGLFDMVSSHPEFVRVGSAYFVNLGHVDSLNAQEMHLDIDRSIRLPRGAYSVLKEQYLRFYCEEDV